IAGPLQGGPVGIRLIEPNKETKVSYFSKVPPPFKQREVQWLILPLYHIFGSERLSTLAPAIAERLPTPYLALNPEDAAKLGVGPGDKMELTLAEESYHLPVDYHD